MISVSVKEMSVSWSNEKSNLVLRDINFTVVNSKVSDYTVAI